MRHFSNPTLKKNSKAEYQTIKTNTKLHLAKTKAWIMFSKNHLNTE